ncbi:MAG: glycosyltransferase family 4 protein [Elusimicrobia bacterium]|nr:glycosyltransferase family 4 protein [Elusimicrobiota bacterium]
MSAPAGIALLPGTTLSDPTHRRVLAGLKAALRSRGWAASAFCPAGTPLSALRSLRPGIVHLHTSGRVTAQAERRVRDCLGRGSKLVLTFQDLGHPDMPRPSAALRRRVAGLARRASLVTALTADLARRVRQEHPAVSRKLRVVGNGVDSGWFRPAGAARRPGDDILAVCRLAPYKGVDLLLWAFGTLAKTRPSARLNFCGRDFQAGHYRRLARRLGIAAKVRFRGEVSRSRLAAELSRARVFVSASRSETYGMAVLEALASGAPVLATRTGVAAELLRHGRDAWLVAPDDASALEQGLARLWSDASLRARLSRRGPKTACKALWDRRALEYGRLYRRVLAGR